MPKYKVLVCQFPGSNTTHPEVGDYLAGLQYRMAQDPRIGEENVMAWKKSDTPITMTRNEALVVAEHRGADYVVMIDSDMHPDCIHERDGGKPFWQTSWDFMLANPRAAMIAAPYCGPPPNESVYIFRWNTSQDQRPNPNMTLEMYDRHTASTQRGIQPVAALPTGLCIINMAAIRDLPHPRFDYEWKDRHGMGEKKCDACGHAIPGERVFKASTEDVFFSRNLWYRGWPVYCNWDAWAGHYKLKLVGPPQRIPIDSFPQMMRTWASDLPPLKIPDPYVHGAPRAEFNLEATDGVCVGNEHGMNRVFAAVEG